MAWGKSVLNVGAIITRGNDVLLVRERLEDGSGERWGMPGGRVEPGEFIPEALVREVREEAGITVLRVGRLVFMSQQFNEPFDESLVLTAFEVNAWEGVPLPNDPDGLVVEAAFTDRSVAIARIRESGRGPSVDPLIAYLISDNDQTRAWFWRVDRAGAKLTAVLPPLDSLSD